ncbi:glycosyltransferase family 2 protein [Microbacterium sp. NPDC087592]|uniref:glycosyltransferase family 2 protein n=1 Tax=Microbacterium sp. NPDC087592 TaxID=3364193 RepID=UPI0037FE424A
MAPPSPSCVSVIVPVYNVSSYVAPCVDSILAQTHAELEVILIDDGSTDDSGLLCDAYAAADSRVHVIHQSNGGLSAARNSGLDVATGDYIICIDGDDVVAVDHIEKLVAEFAHPGVDIAIARFQSTEPREVYPQHGRPAPSPTAYESRDDALVRLFRFDGTTNSAWGKLYRAALFEGIRYPVGALYEDLPTTYRLFLRSERIAFTTYASYFYIQRATSITALRHTARRLDTFTFAAEAAEAVSELPPRVHRAAHARQFMESVFYLSEISVRQNLKTLPAPALAPLRAFRREVLFDKESNTSSRLFALAAYLGPRAVQLLGALRVWLYARRHTIATRLTKKEER